MTKTTSATKRITAVILCAVMMMSVFAVLGGVSAGAVSSSDVQLYSCTPTFAKYGFTTYEIYVTTTNSASSQQVYIHYNYIDYYENWNTQQATYVKTLDNGAKLWKASVSSLNLKYAIKYVSDGVTVWNNNNGNDFTRANVIGQSAPIQVQRLGYQYPYGYTGSGTTGYDVKCVLQNYAYHKNVFVRYTTNNWASYNDAALGYESTNADGTETWTAEINLPNDQYNNVEYAVCYQVNGRTYWANNFGENYDISYRVHQ